MYERAGVDTLAVHIENTHHVTVAKMQQLDIGVFRIDRADKGAPLVARLFSAARTYEAAEGDLAVLRHLADLRYPAERPFGDDPLSTHEQQALLVTEFIKQVPKAKRPAYPIVRLGSMIGRLHLLEVPKGADRPAGALHHFAEGTMTDELRAAGSWLVAMEDHVGESDGALKAVREALATADGGDGLPDGLVHPDPVPKNVIFTADGPVLVDWTAAGRGPRLASLTLVLKSGWAAVPFMKGYTKKVSLDDDERRRLAGLLFSRALIDLVFRTCRNPKTLPAAARKLNALRRESETKAGELLKI